MLDARAILTVSALILPLATAGAQPRRRPAPPGEGPPPVSVTELLDARRALELTPRQVARLDSIERAQFTQRRSLMQRMRSQRDSVCAGSRPCEMSAEQRQQLRDLMTKGGQGPDALWRSDSAGRRLALSLLDSTQRGRVQGWRMAQRRGLARGGAYPGAGRPEFGPGARGFRGGRGGGRPFQDQGFDGPPGGRGFRGQGMGPRYDRGWRRFGPPDGGFDPRFNRRGMRGPGREGDDMGTPMGRRDGFRGPGGGQAPDDTLGPSGMMRRPPRPAPRDSATRPVPRPPVRPDSSGVL